jgi:hypothetical protein
LNHSSHVRTDRSLLLDKELCRIDAELPRAAEFGAEDSRMTLPMEPTLSRAMTEAETGAERRQ